MASGIDLRIHLDVQCETDPSEVLVFATMFDTIRTKMRAGRIKDSADIIEVIKSHPDEMDRVQNMLTENDVDLIYRFERLRWLASIPDP